VKESKKQGVRGAHALFLRGAVDVQRAGGAAPGGRGPHLIRRGRGANAGREA